MQPHARGVCVRVMDELDPQPEGGKPNGKEQSADPGVRRGISCGSAARKRKQLRGQSNGSPRARSADRTRPSLCVVLSRHRGRAGPPACRTRIRVCKAPEAKEANGNQGPPPRPRVPRARGPCGSRVCPQHCRVPSRSGKGSLPQTGRRPPRPEASLSPPGPRAGLRRPSTLAKQAAEQRACG